MSDNLPRPVDLELLSAYLDGELTEDERALVEAQLAASAEWRDELETLRWTVDLLHTMPAAPLPRSFEIPEPVVEAAVAERPTTPALPMGAKPVARPTTSGSWYQNTRWIYTALRSATAVSVALLLAVAGLDVWSNSATFTSSAAQAPVAAQAPPQRSSAPQAPAPASAQQPAAPLAPQAAAEAKKAEAPTAVAKSAAPPALQGPLAAPSAFPQPPRSQSGGGGGGEGGGAGGDSTSSANSIPLDAQLADKQATTTASELPSREIAQAPAATLALPAAGGVVTSAYSAEPGPAPRTDPWRALAYLFGGLAIVFGVGAWLARRRL